VVFLALIIVALAAGLRPDTFFAGDPGVKLVAARNVLARPSRPFEIPLPTIDGTAVPFVEPFFARHGDHTHAVTAEIFPLLSAPFVGLFGLRGAYVLPALGFLLAVVAIAGLGRALDSRRNPLWIGVMAALTTPFLFYGLEFWEHLPAVALAALATLMLVGSPRNKGARMDRSELMPPIPGAPRTPTRAVAFGAGVLFGLATLLRPEAGWFAAAVFIAARWLDPPLPWRAVFAVIGGAAVIAAPLEIYTVLHFGTIAPPHLATNAGLLSEASAGTRTALAKLWFLSAADPSVLRATPAILVALAAPLSRTRWRGAAFLWTVAALDIVLVLLTAPNDGGAQWGPRYLLFAYVPLAILAADAAAPLGTVRVAAAAGAQQGRRPGTARTLLAPTLIAVVLTLGLWSGRASYRTLRGTKAEYGRLVDALAAAAPAGGWIVTDVWWLDQAAAAIASRARFLYADNNEEAAVLMRRLAATGDALTIVTARVEPPVTVSWTVGTCFRTVSTTQLPVRDLVAIRAVCAR
jgi:hypothetical protein